MHRPLNIPFNLQQSFSSFLDKIELKFLHQHSSVLGTVFTARKLESVKKNAVKKFATVFAKRVAKSARPSPCQTCECTADNNGMSYMECFPCVYPSPHMTDYVSKQCTLWNDQQMQQCAVRFISLQVHSTCLTCREINLTAHCCICWSFHRILQCTE